MNGFQLGQSGKGDAKNNIIYDGNSFWAAPYNVPQYITTFLGGQGVNYNFQNYGVGAAAIGNPGSGTNYLLYDIDTQILPERNENRFQDIIMMFELINDLYYQLSINPTTAVDTTYNNFLSYRSKVNKKGFLLVSNTLTPRNDAGAPAGYEAARQDLNSRLRVLYSSPTKYTRIFSCPTNEFAILVDVGADPRFGQAGQTSNATYYQSTDLVHPTATMGQIFASEYYGLTPELF